MSLNEGRSNVFYIEIQVMQIARTAHMQRGSAGQVVDRRTHSAPSLPLQREENMTTIPHSVTSAVPNTSRDEKDEKARGCVPAAAVILYVSRMRTPKTRRA